MRLTQKICKLISIPKSLYVNFRLLPLRQALRMPIAVRWNTRLADLSGSAAITGAVRRGMVSIGFEQVAIFDPHSQPCILDIRGRWNIGGNTVLGTGARISIAPGGVLTTGDGFYNSAAINIVCFNSVTFGEKCVTSWNTLVMDSDIHTTRNTVTGEVRGCDGPIAVGNGVWLCAGAMLLKGSAVADGCIVAAEAVMGGGRFEEPCCLVAGNPAAVRKHGITLHGLRN